MKLIVSRTEGDQYLATIEGRPELQVGVGSNVSAATGDFFNKNIADLLPGIEVVLSDKTAKPAKQSPV